MTQNSDKKTSLVTISVFVSGVLLLAYGVLRLLDIITYDIPTAAFFFVGVALLFWGIYQYL